MFSSGMVIFATADSPESNVSWGTLLGVDESTWIRPRICQPMTNAWRQILPSRTQHKEIFRITRQKEVLANRNSQGSR
ncbi:Inositol-1-monophosphatase [Psidium guajava]|nr:Inositol-1-monophosphatase [Psidium guajava]